MHTIWRIKLGTFKCFIVGVILSKYQGYKPLKADNCCEKVLATRSLKDEVFDSVEDLKHELFQTDVMLFWRKH